MVYNPIMYQPFTVNMWHNPKTFLAWGLLHSRLNLKATVQENVQRLKNVRLRFSFWAYMLLSWVSVIISEALQMLS